MVEITTRFEASFMNGKAVALPEHLLAEHEGKQYLKLRPTSPSICKLLSPSAPSRNPSFSSSPALADLLKKRNEAALVENKEESDEEKQSIWSVAAKEAAPVAVSKKRKRIASTEEPYAVQIDCDGTNYHMSAPIKKSWVQLITSSGRTPIEMGIMVPKDHLWSDSDRVDATWTRTLSPNLSKVILSALFTFNMFRITPCIMVSGIFTILFTALMGLPGHVITLPMSAPLFAQ